MPWLKKRLDSLVDRKPGEEIQYVKSKTDHYGQQMPVRIFQKGQEFIVEDLCPPLCHELWNSIYPLVYALQNGASLEYGQTRAKMFDAKCPDGGRVCIHGEVVED